MQRSWGMVMMATGGWMNIKSCTSKPLYTCLSWYSIYVILKSCGGYCCAIHWICRILNVLFSHSWLLNRESWLRAVTGCRFGLLEEAWLKCDSAGRGERCCVWSLRKPYSCLVPCRRVCVVEHQQGTEQGFSPTRQEMAALWQAEAQSALCLPLPVETQSRSAVG